ncbi:hypothetical protein FOXG_22826 [Fusarium oxysporum f. sp. lycopersici 4287]|uniref:Uncharacterized protein n=1 Tax=Fusarium oxysporum f. sp. lycopersici (strain 4287 / CBS 123668 / FGSC 9935 / NRRL 34936) TaxID=426428 RepID=A0A0J9WC91_FUSO4|nr:hypothetical protein FOXG_22826 [Fusarium oxysporum f. sp. lycopersici 4287]EWZ77594.1 hypothetical protein FOWG_18011 [Fusarium oxysporum f. sp. lycopersici MN25]KNB20468.1 hypothetical protein FOXG_22826 [Fusarium oxysporum f. sp. lycopersici 4287]
MKVEIYRFYSELAHAEDTTATQHALTLPCNKGLIRLDRLLRYLSLD